MAFDQEMFVALGTPYPVACLRGWRPDVNADCRNDSYSEIVEAAAAAAWPREGDFKIVRPEEIYTTIRSLYVSLRRQLFRHSRRTMFTKEECMVFWSLFEFSEPPARGRRQSNQDVNAALMAALAMSPPTDVALLKDIVKQCAVIRGASSADHR
jgi:hypothetical protein